MTLKTDGGGSSDTGFVGFVVDGRYHIDQEIGRGGMGIVYQATDLLLHRKCAVKRLLPQFHANAKVEQRFIREAQRMANLPDSGVVNIYAFGTAPEFGSYFAMELIDGGNLAEYRERHGEFSLDQALQIGAAIANALKAAHANGLVHRDIKPQNILIEHRTGNVRVTDFGIAKSVEDDADESMSRTDDFVGTGRYAAPEQVRLETVDCRADVYALGAVLSEILTGRRFLDDLSKYEIAERYIRDRKWSPALEYPERVPAWVRTVLASCLEPDRDKRTISAADVADALADPQHSVKTLPTSSSRPWFTRGLGVLVLAAISLGFWSVMRPGDPAVPQEGRDRSSHPPIREVESDAAPADLSSAEQARQVAQLAVSFRPESESLEIHEGAEQVFGIEVDSNGHSHEVEWRLDGERVAVGVDEWRLTPSFDSAGSTKVAAIVRLAGETRRQEWQVTIADVDRPPRVKAVVPSTEREVTVATGQRETFTVEAEDPDGKQLQYAWSIDGAPSNEIGNRLDLVVERTHFVAVEIGDGTSEKTLSWKVNAAATPPLTVTGSPTEIETLQFGASQKLSLTPSGSTASVDYEWTLDGRNLGRGPTVLFRATDPRWIRPQPLSLIGKVTNAAKQSATHEWRFRVVPPRPEIKSISPPPAAPVLAEVGNGVRFEIEAAPAVGEQELSVVFELEGTVAAKGSPYTFRVPSEASYRIAGYVTDNYGQRSDATRWHVSGFDVMTRARTWVESYQRAWQGRDAGSIARLRGLESDAANRLARSFGERRDLTVRFEDTKVTRTGESDMRAEYVARESWTSSARRFDAATHVSHVLRWIEGRVVEVQQVARPIGL